MFRVQDIPIAPIMVETNEPHDPSESPVFINQHCLDENGGRLIPTFRSQPESHTVIDILHSSSIKYPEADCVGEQIDGVYKYISYKAFNAQCLAMGRGFLALGLNRGDKIGIYSSNSILWQTAAFGAFSVGMTIVPIYDSLGASASSFITEHAELKAILASPARYPAALELGVDMVIYMGDHPEYHTTTDVLKKGNESTEENHFAKADDVAVIMYTSGSTGVPKGCVLTQANIVAGSTGLGCVNLSLSPGDTFLSFLPLAHIYAMTVELMMYAHGARVGFARGPVEFLVEDIVKMQPTIIVAVPRILNRVYAGMKAKVEKIPPFIRKYVYKIIEAKSQNVKDNTPHSLLIDMILFEKFRAALGGRVRLIVNGGAPISKEVFEFLAAAVTPNIIQGYGLTETSAGVAVQEVPVEDPSTVGPCSISCEVKLRAVEGYDPNGKVRRGELLVRGPGIFREYYKQPDLTNEAFVDGWFCTGDVVEITPKKQMKIIDRAKQLVKLSQGEYISLTNLTEIYGLADLVGFIYVYADSFHDRLLAVVIPKKEVLEEWKARGIEDIEKNPICHDEMIRSLEKVFAEKSLRGFERIRRVLVDTCEPTIENGLLTPSMKPQFASLKKKYGDRLLALYKQMDKESSSGISN